MHFCKTGNETSKAGAGALHTALICSVLFGCICLTISPLAIRVAQKLALLSDPEPQPTQFFIGGKDQLASSGVHSTPLWETPFSTNTLLGVLPLLVVAPVGAWTMVTVRRRAKRRELKHCHDELTPDVKPSMALRKVTAKRNAIFGAIEAEFDQMVAGRSVIGTDMSSESVNLPPGTLAQTALQMVQEQGFRRFLVTHPDGTLWVSLAGKT